MTEQIAADPVVAERHEHAGVHDPNVHNSPEYIKKEMRVYLIVFGALALLLAAVGLYSVIAYNVTQRCHELGVRIALGAQTGDVLRLVVGSGLRVAVAGIVIGGAIALVAGRFIAPLLYRVSPKDPLIYALAGITLLGVAVLASLVPARRATRVDPNTALRAD